MKSILEAKGVVFMDRITYPPLEIREGEVLFITGPSGSGKSTLLKLLNGTISPSKGAVLYKGEDIGGMDIIALRRKAVLAGQTVFLFDKAIRENFAEFYRYREEEMPRQEEMERYLSLCDADFSLDAHCTSMSGGERQRIYLAICLSFDPEILLLDEPTSALDEKTGRVLFENLKAHFTKEGKTLVVVSHDKELADEFGDRTIEIGYPSERTKEGEG